MVLTFETSQKFNVPNICKIVQNVKIPKLSQTWSTQPKFKNGL